MLTLIFCFCVIQTISSSSITEHPKWKLFDHKTCGESHSDRIIGGRKASIGEFPWIARLDYEATDPQDKENKTSLCGGSLLNEDYVLTAAHCIPGPKDKMRVAAVRLGENNADDDVDCEGDVCAPPAQVIKVKDVIMHEEYNDPVKMKHDIALLKLETPAKLNAFVAPICLPHGPALNYFRIGTKMQTAGWGVFNDERDRISSSLLHVRIPTMDMSACAAIMENFTKVGEGQICAGGSKGKDSCSGDSGGPLMKPAAMDGSPRYYLVGVVSFGDSECGTAHPGIYTDVGYYLNWILENV